MLAFLTQTLLVIREQGFKTIDRIKAQIAREARPHIFA